MLNYSSISRKITLPAIVLSISLILSILEIPLPFFPGFLKLDISDTIVVGSIFILNYTTCVLILLLKSCMHFFIKGSSVGVPIDQLVMFLAGFVFLTLFYLTNKITKKVKLMLVFTSIIYTAAMYLINYYLISPIYIRLIGNPPMNHEQYLLFNLIYIPFNLIKATVNSALIFIIINVIDKYYEY